MNNRIYLDHAASTPLHPEVVDVMQKVAIQYYGNPSSIHREGAQAKSIVEECRKKIASFIHTSPGQIIFTSCGTESNNAYLSSVIGSGLIRTVISSPIEHPAVLNTLKFHCKRHHVELKLLTPDQNGMVNIEQLEDQLRKSGQDSLVTLMHTQNELGTVLPLRDFSLICKHYGAKFHSDTIQSIGIEALDVTDLQIDAISGSAHKFNGPKGVGFLYIKEPSQLNPLIFGGNQERNMRGGTENTIGIAGMTRALELALNERQDRRQHLNRLKSKFLDGLHLSGINFEINSPLVDCSPKILNIYFDKTVKSDWLLMNLDIEGIAVSGGSASSSGTEKASHVLEYIRPTSEGRSVRFSFSYLNTEDEIDHAVYVLSKLLS